MASKKYIKSDDIFINPYNFIPIEQKCKKESNYSEKKEQGQYTGWLECSLKTLSPIFIPDTSTVQEDENGNKYSDVFDKKTEDGKTINSYKFFSYPGETKPVIPGSSIRGMIRSSFEAVTNSCLSAIDDEQILYKRVQSVSNIGACRLFKDKNNQWKIQPCKRIGVKVKDINKKKYKNNQLIYDPKKIPNLSEQLFEYEEGAKVSITATNKNNSYPKVIKGKNNNPDKVITLFREVISIEPEHTEEYSTFYSDNKTNFNGYYHKGESFGNRKHHESIFVPNDEPFSIDKITVQNLIDNIKLYQDKTVNLHYKKGEHNAYQHIGDAEKLKLQDMDGALAYCAKHNGRYYLSPAAIGREVFYNRLTDIIGDFIPCTKLENLCEACALFGLAGKGDAAASRIRFTDAILKGDNSPKTLDSPKTLKELASPKLSATEFYLKKPGNPKEGIPDLWNYDYAGNWKRNPNNGRVTNKWSDMDSYQPRIRGRKFYWHHEKGSPYIKNEKDCSERNVHVQTLKKDALFNFRIYFNDITEDELHKLLWLLEIGGRDENAHKIGMGKPIGMGSVEIKVDCIKKREIKIENGTIKYDFSNISKPGYSQVEDKLSKKEDFLKIM